ncbi:MAG: outer membrane protein assembly factor BamD [Deltaproteobacteria bacterium]|nr:outer membrane protein assembly factor BamD [Deltaproteobacteria bacterium]
MLIFFTIGACAGPDAYLSGRKTAEFFYKKANKDLKDGMYPEALAGFAEVKAKYPYSKYAILADLRIADTHYARGKFIEAIDAYKQFIKMHPAHPEIPYCRWRIAEAHVKQAPEEWWFMPPVAEKDQADIQNAIAAYQELIDSHAASEYVKKAQKKIITCRRRLANHELYVANFYWNNEKWRAAAARAEGLVQNYQDVGLEAQALLLAALARKNAKEPELARNDAQKLVEKFPNSNEAQTGRILLQDLPTPSKSAKPKTETSTSQKIPATGE